MDDYYCIEEVSDNEAIDSSDDEDFKSLFPKNESDEEDFESEMERERLSHVNGIHRQINESNGSNEENRPKSQTKSAENENQNMTNDELLYDPKSDENDQKWVDNQRLSANRSVVEKSGVEAIKSDATLNCPACMALLCLDCQRHAIYRTQYRAMFVFNCRTDFTKRLQYKQKQKKRKHNETSDGQVSGVDDYYPVHCTECNTQVAVYDQQEVYHFFGVLASF